MSSVKSLRLGIGGSFRCGNFLNVIAPGFLITLG